MAAVMPYLNIAGAFAQISETETKLRRAEEKLCAAKVVHALILEKINAAIMSETATAKEMEGLEKQMRIVSVALATHTAQVVDLTAEVCRLTDRYLK
jgi:hypothetical protein